MCVSSSKSEDVELKSWLGGSVVKSTHCAGRDPSSVPSIHIQWLTIPPETLAQGGPVPALTPRTSVLTCAETPLYTRTGHLTALKGS